MTLRPGYAHPDQPAACQRLAEVYTSAAEALWEAAMLHDLCQMYDEGREAASHVLAMLEPATPPPDTHPMGNWRKR